MQRVCLETSIKKKKRLFHLGWDENAAASAHDKAAVMQHDCLVPKSCVPKSHAGLALEAAASVLRSEVLVLHWCLGVPKMPAWQCLLKWVPLGWGLRHHFTCRGGPLLQTHGLGGRNSNYPQREVHQPSYKRTPKKECPGETQPTL